MKKKNGCAIHDILSQRHIIHFVHSDLYIVDSSGHNMNRYRALGDLYSKF